MQGAHMGEKVWAREEGVVGAAAATAPLLPIVVRLKCRPRGWGGGALPIFKRNAGNPNLCETS